MTFRYNPLDKTYNKKGGTIKQGSNFTVSVSFGGENCDLILYSDKSGKSVVYPMQKVCDMFTVSIFNLKTGLYFYYFKADNKLYGKGNLLNAERQTEKNLSKYQLTVYKRTYKVPSWLSGGIIYQIFPDRFCKAEDKEYPKKEIMRAWGEEPYYKPNAQGKILNNDFFGGNFKGIESKLDYLKSLNVTAIYLNPVSKSYSNHRYDTSNYLEFDSLLGTDGDFISLVEKAKEKGIKIIFDGVFNHTGDDSLYFNKYGNFDTVGAYQSKDSPYYDWYVFDKFPDEYLSWWGINVLPTINKKSKEFENFVLDSVFKRYFELGAFGVRLDVVDELPTPFVKKIRKAVKEYNEDAVIIGEVWEDATNKIAYSSRREYFMGDELDSVMNYPLKNAIISFVLTGDATELKSVILEQLNNYPKDALNVLMNLLGTHDTPRILTVLSGKIIPNEREEASKFTLTDSELELAVSRLKLAVCLLFTLYGVPSIYYGDEIGLEGCKDPFNRRCFNWQSGNQDIFKTYQKLSNIRKSDVFKNGETELLETDAGVLAFKRTLKGEEVLVIANAGESVYKIDGDIEYLDLISETYSKSFELKKYSYLILTRR